MSGGLFFTIVAANIFYYSKAFFSLNFYILLAIFIATLSTLGDLVQSKFKRYADVKDSGYLIPGHGGFFDRMDSVIFSAPWVYFLIKLNHYVS